MKDTKLIAKIGMSIGVIVAAGIIEIFTEGWFFGFSADLMLLTFIIFASITQFKIAIIESIVLGFLYPIVTLSPWMLKSIGSYLIEGVLVFVLASTISFLADVKSRKALFVFVWLVLFYIVKYFIHVAAGILFWGAESWAASASINMPYVVANLILGFIIVIPTSSQLLNGGYRIRTSANKVK